MAESPLDKPITSRSLERILIPVSKSGTCGTNWIQSSILIQSPKKKAKLYALSINQSWSARFWFCWNEGPQKTLSKASETAAATDHFLYELLCYDTSIEHGISSVSTENKITCDLILGLHEKQGMSDSLLGISPKISLAEVIRPLTSTSKLESQPFWTHRKTFGL